jgi:hypothetical protein
MLLLLRSSIYASTRVHSAFQIGVRGTGPLSCCLLSLAYAGATGHSARTYAPPPPAAKTRASAKPLSQRHANFVLTSGDF